MARDPGLDVVDMRECISLSVGGGVRRLGSVASRGTYLGDLCTWARGSRLYEAGLLRG
jgi:hypothetical protein